MGTEWPGKDGRGLARLGWAGWGAERHGEDLIKAVKYE